MKRIATVGALIVAAASILAIWMATQFGEPSPIFVGGIAVVDDELQSRASLIQTLYIVLYDEENPMPMPFGAMKVKLSDSKNLSKLSFDVTPEKLQRMNPNDPKIPRSFRVKARLDLDGVAGADQPGDLTGEVTGVAAGTRDLQIKIDRYVSGS